MPKFSTFPTLYDDALQISLFKLKEWGYLNPGQSKSGTITWSRNGNKRGSISIRVNTLDVLNSFVELDYKCGDKPRNYKVHLVSIPSNLGSGEIWYFLCPDTGKRCRKLYSVDGYFLHREAFNGCMYECQTRSKKWRWIDKTYGAYFESENAYMELFRKHFKKTYAGKPTKRYIKLLNLIHRSEMISSEDIERLFLPK